MLREKNQETNVSESIKWRVSNTILLCRILNLRSRSPIWKITRKKVNTLSTKKGGCQFQFGCVSYLNLKQNKAFKYQVDNLFSYQFYYKMSQQMRKSLKQDNTRVVDLITFYKNRNSLIFNVLVFAVYSFLENMFVLTI